MLFVIILVKGDCMFYNKEHIPRFILTLLEKDCFVFNDTLIGVQVPRMLI